MSRPQHGVGQGLNRFPRTRGDEPRKTHYDLEHIIVFPARAGMSREVGGRSV